MLAVLKHVKNVKKKKKKKLMFVKLNVEFISQVRHFFFQFSLVLCTCVKVLRIFNGLTLNMKFISQVK